ncbi:MAG: glycosyltransferase [Halioglobus sp.]
MVGGTRRGQPKEPGSVLFAGRFVEKKNIPALLSAMARLVREGKAVTLYLAGDGPLRPELESLVTQLGIERRVRFLGWLERDALLARIAASELVIFCSHGSEGMPMVILETLRTDSLLVAAPQRFTDSYDLRPCGAIYLEDDSSEQIAAGIIGGLERGVSVEELLARDTFMLNFSPERVRDEFLALYRSVLAMA